MVRTSLNWLKIDSSGGSCEHGKEIWGSVKGGDIFDQLSNYQVLRKDFTTWS
jgi:hypothetical protein